LIVDIKFQFIQALEVPTKYWLDLSHAHVRNTGLAMAIAISSFPETLGSKKGWRLRNNGQYHAALFQNQGNFKWSYQIIRNYVLTSHIFWSIHKISISSECFTRKSELSGKFHHPRREASRAAGVPLFYAVFQVCDAQNFRDVFCNKTGDWKRAD